jgi:hypothetical protein
MNEPRDLWGCPSDADRGEILTYQGAMCRI